MIYTGYLTIDHNRTIEVDLTKGFGSLLIEYIPTGKFKLEFYDHGFAEKSLWVEINENARTVIKVKMETVEQSID